MEQFKIKWILSRLTSKIKNIGVNIRQKEESMEGRTKTYRTPIVRIKFTDNDVITASTVEGQGNFWNVNENPWEPAVMEGEGQ